MFPWEANAPPPRKPARDTYDAHVGLLPMRGAATSAYALIKRVYSFTSSSCEPAEAEPLVLGPVPGQPAPLPLGADFWPRKQATDVVVQGAARPPRGTSPDRMLVTLRVGAAEKRILVFGRRMIRKAGAGVRVTPPDSITGVPLTVKHAYGGLDPRVPAEPARGVQIGDVELLADHPGAYPRNLWGKGYLVGEAPADDIEMPGLEDPDDLLSEERLIVRDPAAWYEQPLPWHADWVSAREFPRCLRLFGADAWFPGPEDDRMVEVRRGYLPAGYRKTISRAVDPDLAQEATYGLVLRGLSGGERVSLTGMDPDAPELSFPLPEPPRMELSCEGAREASPARIHSIVVRPEARSVVLVLGTELALPRTFVPGIHKRIPVSLSVDGDSAIWFEAPPTLKERAGRPGG